MESLTQLYNAFMAMSFEQMSLVGIGSVVFLLATPKIWKLLFPLRWVGAKTLAKTASTLHSTPKDNKVFDLSSEKAVKKTYDFYSENRHLAYNLTNDELEDLDAFVNAYDISGTGVITAVRDSRSLRKPPPFDLSTKEKAQATYDYYCGTDVVQALSLKQMGLVSEAINLYGLTKNNGITDEKKRREMQKKISELQSKVTQMQEESSGISTKNPLDKMTINMHNDTRSSGVKDTSICDDIHNYMTYEEVKHIWDKLFNRKDELHTLLTDKALECLLSNCRGYGISAVFLEKELSIRDKIKG
jgi:hypothetical protein